MRGRKAGSPRPIRRPLMTHQDRDRHRSQHVPRGATEYQFAQARMAPRAHDEHVGATIGDGREEYLADGGIVRGWIRGRSDERRVGYEWVRTCRCRWSQVTVKKNNLIQKL